MRICFVSKEDVEEYLQKLKQAEEREECELTLFGFNGAGEVSYEKELKGETAYFEGIAKLSRMQNSVVVCGCVTNACGHKRKSAVVAERGKILGVSDTLHAVDGKTACGAELRVYETALGKMGVAVADDLRFPEVFKTLVLCGSDFIVCPAQSAEEIQSALLRAHAYCYGTQIYFCAKGCVWAADTDGNLAFSSQESPAVSDFVYKKEYRLVETRRRLSYERK